MTSRITYVYDDKGRILAAICTGLVGRTRPQDNRAISGASR